MPSKVQRRRRGDKPRKPHPDFPLTANGNGQWSKKIRGKVYYFGRWVDPDGALKRYLEVKDDLLAGRRPRPQDGFTLTDLANSLLTTKKLQLDGGELTPRTFYDYHRVCERILSILDGNRLVDDLDTDDFRQLREKLAGMMGPVALGNEISRMRVVFNFAFNNGHIDRPVRFGVAFKRPSRRVLRRERQKKGPRMFEADEIRSLLIATDGQIRAIILLGINCGFGNHDCAILPKDALDLQAAWVDFPRPKTAIDRRVPLWAETIQAVQIALDRRPKPKDKADDNLVFLTKYGQRWVRTQPSTRTEGKLVASDSIAQEIRKLIRKLGLRGGRNFYALRHTFETIGGEARDQIAVDAIMGHVRDDMASVHRERISDDRLTAVTNYVHDWLFDSNKRQRTEGGRDHE